MFMKLSKAFSFISISPYFSEKQQLLWSVQNCQKGAHQILDHIIRQKLKRNFIYYDKMGNNLQND